MKEALARHLTGASGVSSILQMHFELLHAHGGLGRVAPRWRENADQIVAYGEVLRRRDEDEPSPLDGGFSQQGAVDPQFDLVDQSSGFGITVVPCPPPRRCTTKTLSFRRRVAALPSSR